MITTYKPHINFYVEYREIGYNALAKQGILIHWEHPAYMSRLRERSYIPSSITISRSNSINGIFEQVAKVDPLKLEFLDENGFSGAWYTLTLEDTNGNTLLPTIAKTADQPKTCRIYGNCLDASGIPLVDTGIYFNVPKLPANNQVNGILLGAGPIEVRTDKAGYFEIDLLVGSSVEVHSTGIGINKLGFIVPDAISKNLYELI